MATLKQIAEEAGVSVKTVSNILNGHTQAHWPKVAERAKRVLAIAERLNYKPNPTARHLRGGRKGKIAIVAAQWLGFFPAGLLHGITKALVAEQLSLAFHYLEKKCRTEDLLKVFSSDGILFNGSALAFLRDDPDEALRGLPAVLVNYPAKVNAVGVADREGTENLVLTAATRGQRPVAFLSTTPDHWSRGDLFSVRERRQGYREAMKTIHDEPRELLPSRLLQDGEIQDFVTSSLESLPTPVAVFVHEPWEASFVLGAATELGRRVPEDVLPLLLDTYELTERPNGLPMVVSRVDWNRVGALAFMMLKQRIANPETDVPSIRVSFDKPFFHRCSHLRADE